MFCSDCPSDFLFLGIILFAERSGERVGKENGKEKNRGAVPDCLTLIIACHGI